MTFERIASHRPGTTLGQCFKLFAGTRRPPEPRFQGAESASWDSPPRWRHRGKSFPRPWPPAGAAAPMAVFTPPAAALRAGSALSPGRGPSLPSGASCPRHPPGAVAQAPGSRPAPPRAFPSLVAEARRPGASQTRSAAPSGAGADRPPWRWPSTSTLEAGFKDKSRFQLLPLGGHPSP